ncbi:MAG TPA: ribonuclease E/G, partial [Acidimicrobiaceae bacterium]|nr:ribonuclease E/G [Acidimicrobiaceae bacterium]
GRRPAGGRNQPVEAILADERPAGLDEQQMSRRRGSQRDGEPLGRYRMYVSVSPEATHIAITEGRVLIEHYVSRPSDDITEIYGNLYLGRVRRVLPGMEAAFVDIGTPKHAVLYRGDLGTDAENLVPAEAGLDNGSAGSAGNGSADNGSAGNGGSEKRRGRDGRRNRSGPRIETLLKSNQQILCQVTKNPLGHKGARLTTDVSLPGRYVVLVPNSSTMGISRRLDARTARRLRSILSKVVPTGFGVILRTAAEHAGSDEIARDIERLVQQWNQISDLSKRLSAPSLLFREPEMALRLIREEFNSEFREVVVDDRELYEQVRGYMETIDATSADRIVRYDTAAERLPLMERYQIAEQLRKALDRKVWLPSGGSLVIEHTEALTVIDVNTGRNVGKSSLNETILHNNLEAAEEVARQLRLRDIGGIIVIDFVDMDAKREREQLTKTFEAALARDKTRTYVEPMSDLGLVQMTRRRIGEGLLESVSDPCEDCGGIGLIVDEALVRA